MSNSYSLTDLRNDLDREFAPVEIAVGKDKVVLRNMMRLGKDERQAVQDSIGQLQDNPDMPVDDILGLVNAVFLAVADKGSVLVDAIGDDLTLAMKILTAWTEATQPGEAQNSPS